MSRFWSFFKKLKLTFLNYHVKKNMSAIVDFRL